MKKLWILEETFVEGFTTYTAINNEEELQDYLLDAKSDTSTKLELRSFDWESGKVEPT